MESEKIFIVVQITIEQHSLDNVQVNAYSTKEKALYQAKQCYLTDKECCSEAWLDDENYEKDVNLEDGYFHIHEKNNAMNNCFEVFIVEQIIDKV